VEDHDPLSLEFRDIGGCRLGDNGVRLGDNGGRLGDNGCRRVWCNVCSKDMHQLDVVFHLKGTGSPWWVTRHRRMRHETLPLPDTEALPEGEPRETDVFPPDETHLQGFQRYVANFTMPRHLILLEDSEARGEATGQVPGGATGQELTAPESRRLYCEVCRAVIIDHSQSQSELIRRHLEGAAHRHCAAVMAPCIDWLAERHPRNPRSDLQGSDAKRTVTPSQKAIITKVQRNLRVRVKAREALDLPPEILFGAPVEWLIGYIADRFQAGMSWMNYGSWHIDHVMPVAAFDTADPLQCLVMCHYTNLQPLWGHDNLAKGAALEPTAAPPAGLA
jgi:hypothetical protein